MIKLEKLSIVILRIAIGWFFLYQGINAILTPKWALPFISSAHTFPQFYKAILDPGMLPHVTLLVKGLFLLVGICLLLGIFVRTSSLLGIMVLLFFYFALLQFPYVDNVYYVVDYRLIVAAALFVIGAFKAGDHFSIRRFLPFSNHHS